MPEYVFAYHGGPILKSPEEGAEYMERWGAWVKGLGDAMPEPSTYLRKPMVVGPEGVSPDAGPNPLSGYSVVTAESMNAAIEMAKRSPHVEHGTIEVAEVLEMPN